MSKHPNHELSALPCPHQLADVDLFSPGAQEHWYEAYEILHQQAPVHRIPGEGLVPGSDAFILSRYEDIARVVKDEQRFPPALSLMLKGLIDSGAAPEDQKHLNVMVASMMTLRPNPELWRAHRQELTDPWVGPGASRHENTIRSLANGLIDDWIADGEVEFVTGFAQPLPQKVMATIIGWPLEDLTLLKQFGDATVRAFVYGSGHRSILPSEEVKAQFKDLEAFKQYTNELIELRRRTPEDDMISFLTQVEYSPLQRKLKIGRAHV